MKTKYLSSNLQASEAQRIHTDLLVLFEVEKVYQNPNLCLKTLANQLQTNTKYLSQVINQQRKVNFQVFINQYRIEEFKQRLINGDAQQLTYYGLAQECGFNNRSTFYRAFNSFTHQTPKQFLNHKQAA